MGATVLVGITQRDPSGAIVARRQFHGPVTEVADGVVVVRHQDGDVLLPAEPDAYSPARPGRYTLASGEVVIDPGYLSTWSVSPDPPRG